MRTVFLISGALVALALVVWLYGLSQPQRRTLTADRIVALPFAEVAARLRDVADYPAWRRGVTMEGVAETDGTWRYVERAGARAVNMTMRETEADRRFTVVIASPDYAEPATRVVVLTPDNGGTRVMMVETGVVANPLLYRVRNAIWTDPMSLAAFIEALAATGRAAA